MMTSTSGSWTSSFGSLTQCLSPHRLRPHLPRARSDGFGPEPEDSLLHELRKRAKRARYIAELIDPLVQGKASGFAARLADLQDVLGKLQDSVVADQWLRSHSASEVTPREVFAI